MPRMTPTKRSSRPNSRPGSRPSSRPKHSSAPASEPPSPSPGPRRETRTALSRPAVYHLHAPAGGPVENSACPYRVPCPSAQRLYEQGLITYMRTDSVNLSQQALAQCKEEIIKLYGEKYSRWFNYKTKTKGAQEGTRGPSVPRTSTGRRSTGTAEEKRLYDLIWKRTVASQMVCAELDRTTIAIDMSGSDQQFVAQGGGGPFRRVPAPLLRVHGRRSGQPKAERPGCQTQDRRPPPGR